MNNGCEVTAERFAAAHPVSEQDVERSHGERFSETVLAIHRAGSFLELAPLRCADPPSRAMPEWEIHGIREHADLRWSHIAERQVMRPNDARSLTPQEHVVLRGISKGLTDAQIAVLLGIARRTASKHVEAIYRKLAVETRTAAAQVCRSWNEG